MVMRGPQDTVRKHAHGSEDVHLGIHKIRMALALSSCGSRRIYKLGEADSYFANIKLKHARLAGRLALLWGLESVPRFGEREPAKAVPLQATCPPSPGLSPSEDDQAEEVGGEHSSAFIFGPNSLKISPPSCLITLPFDLDESRPVGPAPPSARCPLKEKGVGTGSCLRSRDGPAGWGRCTDIRAALAPLQPPAQPGPPRGRGEAARCDWLAPCERPRGLAGAVLEGVPLSN